MHDTIPHTPPVALTIAGSDCSAGAGLQADLKTFQHYHVHGLCAVTCVVSETANIVRSVHPVPVPMVIDQASLLLDSFPVAAVKTGMLYSADLVRQTAALLQRSHRPPLVVDPVMVASTGDPLLESDAIAAYLIDLLPLATLVTPNIPEAETLLKTTIRNEHDMEQAALELALLCGTSILLKGGHLTGDSASDVLAHHGRAEWFTAPRIPSHASHGTGCTLSAAITASLAHGHNLPHAIATAKHFLGQSIATSYSFPSHPPLHALNQSTLPISQHQ